MFNQGLSCSDQSHLQKGTLFKVSPPPPPTISLKQSPSENTLFFRPAESYKAVVDPEGFS